MSTLAASEARAELPALLDRVTEGDEVVITRYGQPIAVVVRPDSLRVRRAASVFANADHVRERLARARDVPLSDAPRLSEESAEELVVYARVSRDAPDATHLASAVIAGADRFHHQQPSRLPTHH